MGWTSLTFAYLVAAALARLTVGGRTTLSVSRDGKVRDLTIGVIERPAQQTDDPDDPLAGGQDHAVVAREHGFRLAAELVHDEHPRRVRHGLDHARGAQDL